jgi:hypothetical protein
MTETLDFFRARLDGMVDAKHPLVVLSKRLPWGCHRTGLGTAFLPQAPLWVGDDGAGLAGHARS